MTAIVLGTSALLLANLIGSPQLSARAERKELARRSDNRGDPGQTTAPPTPQRQAATASDPRRQQTDARLPLRAGGGLGGQWGKQTSGVRYDAHVLYDPELWSVGLSTHLTSTVFENVGGVSILGGAHFALNEGAGIVLLSELGMNRYRAGAGLLGTGGDSGYRPFLGLRGVLTTRLAQRGSHGIHLAIQGFLGSDFLRDNEPLLDPADRGRGTRLGQQFSGFTLGLEITR